MFCTWGAAAPAGGRAPGSACRTRPFALSQTAQRPFLFCFCLFFLCCFFSLPLFFSPLSFVCFYFLNEIYENSYFLNTFPPFPPPLLTQTLSGLQCLQPRELQGLFGLRPFPVPSQSLCPLPRRSPSPLCLVFGGPCIGCPWNGVGEVLGWVGSMRKNKRFGFFLFFKG